MRGTQPCLLTAILLEAMKTHIRDCLGDEILNLQSATHSAHPLNTRALLNEHVRKHGGEFVDLRRRLLSITQNHDHRTCVGYINRGPDGSDELLFSNAKLLEICGSRGALQQLKRQLKAEGAAHEQGPRPTHNSNQSAANDSRR